MSSLSPLEGITFKQYVAWYFLGRKPAPMPARRPTLILVPPLPRSDFEERTDPEWTGARSHEEAGYSKRA